MTKENWQMKNDELIFAGKMCPYCNRPTQYVNSKIVYGKKSNYGMIYYCKPCKAWVGVHPGTDIALGRLADSKLRKAKIAAHKAFDQIARTNLINKVWPKYIPKLNNRRKAYMWLAKQMNMTDEECHIGRFNILECKRVITICNRVLTIIEDQS